jgi:hypothetical protein
MEKSKKANGMLKYRLYECCLTSSWQRIKQVEGSALTVL